MSGRTCTSCGSAIRWGVTTLGSKMPLDPEPHPLGAVWIKPDGRFRVLDRGERERARAAGEVLYRSHFETCPAAERHRNVSRDQLGLGL